MKKTNFFKSVFHIFILIYILFFFYWQSEVYDTTIYEIPHVIKIGIPIFIKEFCYQDINGEFSGIIIDKLNEIFIKKLNINVEYVYIKNKNEYCDCILNVIGKKNNKKHFLHSQSILDYISLLQINKNNNNNNNKIVALKNDVLFLLNSKKKNYVFLDSIEEIITFLELHNDYDLLISQIYYNDINKIIINKNYKIEDYQIKKIRKKIESINLLFSNTLYWLIIYFNNIVHKLERN